MATQIPETNAAAAFLSMLISAAIQGGEVAVEALIAAEMPFLELPVVNLFTNEVIKVIGDAIYRNMAEIVTLVVIDVQTNGENSAVVQASKDLQAAQDAGDPDAIQKATDAAVAAWADLAQSDGYFSPHS